MVGVGGFEPPAPASRRQCSTRLSYTPPTWVIRRAGLIPAALSARNRGAVSQGIGRRPVDGTVAVEDHAIGPAGRLDADQVVPDVVGDVEGRAPEEITPTASGDVRCCRAQGVSDDMDDVARDNDRVHGHRHRDRVCGHGGKAWRPLRHPARSPGTLALAPPAGKIHVAAPHRKARLVHLLRFSRTSPPWSRIGMPALLPHETNSVALQHVRQFWVIFQQSGSQGNELSCRAAEHGIDVLPGRAGGVDNAIDIGVSRMDVPCKRTTGRMVPGIHRVCRRTDSGTAISAQNDQRQRCLRLCCDTRPDPRCDFF